jgi:hypothetical protein
MTAKRPNTKIRKPHVGAQSVLVFAIYFVTLIAIYFVTLMLIAHALAEEHRPLPVPQLSTGCPPGCSSSPTLGTCVRSGNTRCRAFPGPTGNCPVGWTYTPTCRATA